MKRRHLYLILGAAILAWYLNGLRHEAKLQVIIPSWEARSGASHRSGFHLNFLIQTANYFDKRFWSGTATRTRCRPRQRFIWVDLRQVAHRDPLRFGE